MAKKIFLGNNFEYQPEYTRDEFLKTFFENPDSILTITEVMEEQLRARAYKGPKHQIMNNSWWGADKCGGISTMTKSGIARWKVEEKYLTTNMMKVIPDLGKIAKDLSQHYKKKEENSYEQGIEVPQKLINSLDGYEFVRHDFNYLSQTDSITIEEILKDPILGGICKDNPRVLREYLKTLFEIGGTPKESKWGTSGAHLRVMPHSGTDKPHIDFYMIGSRGLSDSPISRSISNPRSDYKYPTIKKLDNI